MAKTIKFNLMLDNKPVRNIEGLQENFSIEDMLKYFKNGLLLKWLDVRGCHAQYDKVSKIDKNDDKSIIKELIKVFEIETDESKLDLAIGILKYLEEEKELNAIYKENAFKENQIIDDYHSGYDALIRHMEDNCDNIAVLKADAIELERKYFGLFRLDFKAIYLRFEESAPKAIYTILMRPDLRKFWLNEESKYIYERLVKNILLNAKDILGDDLKIVSRNTQAMWDPIERKEVKLMVISIKTGTFVKNAGEFSEKLGSEDVNGKFLLFNGLEYQCNDESFELLYMEV